MDFTKVTGIKNVKVSDPKKQEPDFKLNGVIIENGTIVVCKACRCQNTSLGLSVAVMYRKGDSWYHSGNADKVAKLNNSKTTWVMDVLTDEIKVLGSLDLDGQPIDSAPAFSSKEIRATLHGMQYADLKHLCMHYKHNPYGEYDDSPLRHQDIQRDHMTLVNLLTPIIVKEGRQRSGDLGYRCRWNCKYTSNELPR
jgi:hypothetical protein